MTADEPRNDTARCVEALVNVTAAAGLNPVEVALTMLAAGADILTRAWDAPRALSAFDELVLIAARNNAEPTTH